MKHILFNIFLITPYFGLAQSIQLTAQNSTGFIGGSTNGFSLTYSVGELASIAEFISTNNFVLSTGLLQTFKPLVTSLNEISLFEGADFKIYPNPTIHYLQITANLKNSGQVQIQLLDAEARVKYMSEPYSIINLFNKQIDLSNYTAGVYYLHFKFQPTLGQTKNGIFKLIKL